MNLRDQHMAETLDALVAHLGRKSDRPRLAVWEHTYHLGDARAMGMGQRGELNVGQLTRKKYGNDTVLVGLPTHHRTVTAASNWGGPAECKRAFRQLRSALPFHTARPIPADLER
jgi:erythromycin esterase-like protein